MGVAVAYCRVSTQKQEDSIKDQQEQWADILKKQGDIFANCGAFYKKNGNKEFRYGLYVDEGISAKEYKKHREAFKQMIEDAILGKFKLIYVEDVTRFARNVEDGMKIIKDLRERQVNVHFRKENLDTLDVKNDMVLGVLFSVAEQEIKTDSARFKWKQDKLHRAGKWTAPAPYGYNVCRGILSINDKEQPVVDLIFYLYTEKLLGCRAIANYLNERGFRTRRGKLWKHTEISYILKNPIYKGDVINHRTESYDITRGTIKHIPEMEQIKLHIEELRIIDDLVWDKKEIIMSERSQKLKNREGHSTKHLLSTLLYCEQCGSTFIRVKRKPAKNENGQKVNRGYEWTCLGHNHYGDIKCKGRYTLAENELIPFIKNELKEEQKKNNSEFLKLYIENRIHEKDNIDIKVLQEEREDINLQMVELRRERNKKLINDETFEQQLQLLSKRLEEIHGLEQKYNNINIDIERAEIKFNNHNKMLENLNFNKLTNVELKQILKKIKVLAEEENGYKKIYLHFSYNFLDETKTELLRREFDGVSSITEMYKTYKIEKIRKSTKTRYFEKVDKE